jgi:hypothetical protein
MSLLNVRSTVIKVFDIRAAADQDRYAIDLELNHSGTGLNLASRQPPLRNNRRSRIHNRRHKLQPVCPRTARLGFSQLTSPAKQLLRR